MIIEQKNLFQDNKGIILAFANTKFYMIIYNF